MMRAVGSPSAAVRQRRQLQERQVSEGERAFERREGISFAAATQGPGFVPCCRQGCRQRHSNTLLSKCGFGFCSHECADAEWEAEKAITERHPDPCSLQLQDFTRLDPSLACVLGPRVAGWSVESLLAALKGLEASRAASQGAALEVAEQSSGQETIAEVAEKFAHHQSSGQRRTVTVPQNADLNDQYRVAHNIFPGAWAAVWVAAHAAGLSADALHYGFASARSIMRREAIRANGSPLTKPTCVQHGDFLRFAIVFPDNAVGRLWDAYEALVDAVEVVSVSNNLRLNASNGVMSSGHGMTLVMECCLQDHVFLVEFLFSAFTAPGVQNTTVQLACTAEWLELLQELESWSADLVIQAILQGNGVST